MLFYALLCSYSFVYPIDKLPHSLSEDETTGPTYNNIVLYLQL